MIADNFCVINDKDEIIAMSANNDVVTQDGRKIYSHNENIVHDGYRLFYESVIGPFRIIDNGDGVPRLKST